MSHMKQTGSGRVRLQEGGWLFGIVLLVTLLAGLPSSASAVAPAPVWMFKQQSLPTNLAPGGSGAYEIRVANVGVVPSTADSTVVVTLPQGVTATHAGDAPGYNSAWDCPGAAGSSVVTCTLIVANVYGGRVEAAAAAPGLVVSVDVGPDAGGAGVSTATVSAGGANRSATSTLSTRLSSQPAGFGITDFEGWATDAMGNAARQAGGHPDVTTSIDFSTVSTAQGPAAAGNVKDISVDLPPGLVGDPTAVPTCSAEAMSRFDGARCSPESQVGVAEPITTIFGSLPVGRTPGLAVYNIEPPAGSPGRFAFSLGGVVVNLDPVVRTGGDYGITVHVKATSQALPLAGSVLTLWGVPADPVHDPFRVVPATGLTTPSNLDRKPFLTAPTECSGQPLVTRMTANSWQEPGIMHEASFSTDFTGQSIVTEGCGRLPFSPGFEVRPESPARRGAPAGLGIDVTVPQNENPDGLVSAMLKKAVVTLPEGAVVNPSSAQGLQACSAAQIDIKGSSSPSCPLASKIGSAEIDTPLLAHSLEGGVFLAKQNDNPFGTTLAMYIVAKGAGVVLKLPGRIDADAKTGRVTTTFDNNPQLPFSKLSLHLKTGARAPLSLPSACGPAETTAVLTPWSGTAPVTLRSSFDVSSDGQGGACGPRGFAPTFNAGTTNPMSGKDSPFMLSFSRTDDDQELSGLMVDMPKGLLGRIAKVTPCEAPAAAAGTCSEGSKIGSVTTHAGAGSNPIALPGRVYLTGPYQGAPYGLAVVVPAIAGPLDLGTVVVRAAIYVDPITAQLRVVSDPLPTILDGIPLQVRSVQVSIDRPGFMFNPTSCTPSAVNGQLTSTANGNAAVAARFQVGDCASLDLKPRLALTLSGKGQTSDGKHPAVTASLTQPAGQANLKKVRVALPLALALDPDNAASDGLCSFAEGSKPDPQCPKSSIVGTAVAVTPILAERLMGPVFFVKNERKDPKSGRSIKTTPKLVIRLVGQNGVKLTLTGTSTVVDDQLVTTFDNIPDAPVSGFKLNINGGKKGILVISAADICKATQIADQQVDGQNGKSADADVSIQTPSCPLKVLSKKVGKSSVAIKVGGLGAGKVTITGKGIKKTTKAIAKSTVATLTAKRTKGKLGSIKVSFLPAGTKKAKVTTAKAPSS